MSRRRLVIGLVVALLTLAFEAGLHSTHHLGDPVRGAECALALATAHLDGAPVDTVGLAPAVDAALDGPLLLAPVPLAARRVATTRVALRPSRSPDPRFPSRAGPRRVMLVAVPAVSRSPVSPEVSMRGLTAIMIALLVLAAPAGAASSRAACCLRRDPRPTSR